MPNRMPARSPRPWRGPDSTAAHARTLPSGRDGIPDRGRRPSRGVLTAAFLLGPLLATGCGDGGSPTDPPPPPPPVQVSITPSAASLDQGATASFTATVTNAQNTAVTWTATGGTLSGQGSSATLTAPTAAGQVTVTATSVADGTRSASATVTVAAVGLALDAPAAPVLRHGTATVSAQVTGTVETGVSWETTCEGVTTEGGTATWAAPGTLATCQLTATSTADPSRAATAELSVDPAFVVNATNDEDDGRCDPAHCSLREALVLGLAELDEGEDEIQVRFAPALEGGTLTLAAALPTLRGAWSITGPGPQALTLDAHAAEDGNRRHFTLDGARLHLEGLTLTGGDVGNLAAGQNHGGSILVDQGGEFRLRNAVVEGNRAGAIGGGIAGFNGSTLDIAGSRVVGNAGVTSGGGVATVNGSLQVEDSEVADNTANVAAGIHSVGSEVLVREVRILGNVSSAQGGGLSAMVGSNVRIEDALIEENHSINSWGGGLNAMTGSAIVAVGVTLRGNRALNGGGGAYLFESSLELTDSVVEENESGNNAGGGLYFRGAQGTLSGTRIVDNLAENGGGGGVAILFESEVTMEAMEVTGNEARGSAASGGGVFIGSNSQVTWAGGTLRENRAGAQGGGVSSGFSQTTLRNLDVAGNEAVTFGGGMAVSGPSPFLAEGLTLRENEAGNGGGGASLQPSEGNAVLRNLTVSGNRALNGAAFRIGGSVLLEHVTVVGNLSSPADPAWGGAAFVFGATTEARFRHLLMDANLTDGEPRGCVVLAGGATIVSEGGNVIGDEACSTWVTQASDRLGVDPGVAADLGDHGGPTLTHALAAESPAIGAGNPDTCPTTDQRGFLRTNGCDAGAVQANGSAPSAGGFALPPRLPRR